MTPMVGEYVDIRRKTVCPSSWIDTIPLDRPHQCPMPNQPKWFSKKCAKTKPNSSECKADGWVNVDGPEDPVMYQTTDKNGVVTIDKNQMARKRTEVDFNSGSVVSTKYSKVGAVMSCDEWPAARCV